MNTKSRSCKNLKVKRLKDVLGSIMLMRATLVLKDMSLTVGNCKGRMFMSPPKGWHDSISLEWLTVITVTMDSQHSKRWRQIKSSVSLMNFRSTWRWTLLLSLTMLPYIETRRSKNFAQYGSKEDFSSFSCLHIRHNWILRKHFGVFLKASG